MYVISPIGSRDFSVDLLKFLAIFLIINSHSDIAYPAFSILATGGGLLVMDCFCSALVILCFLVRIGDSTIIIKDVLIAFIHLW